MKESRHATKSVLVYLRVASRAMLKNLVDLLQFDHARGVDMLDQSRISATSLWPSMPVSARFQQLQGPVFHELDELRELEDKIKTTSRY